MIDPPSASAPQTPRAGLPVGVVTLLFTDIEGSTRLIHRLGEGFGAVLELHHRLLRDAITTTGGSVVNTQGDAFFAVFERPDQAIRAALEAQRRLATTDWPHDAEVRVRMGIHTGTVQLRATDYVGIDVHRAARIMGAGHGGQVLVSATSAAPVAGHLPATASLRDLGAHRLKDFAEPIGLFQLVHPDLATDFPPLATVDIRRSELPIPASPFVGRESELADLVRLLRGREDRLVTLLGPGGSGKTRLGLRVAAEVQGGLRDGVVFVDLAPVTDVDAALGLIATAVGATQSREQPVLEELKRRLRDQDLLLLLDNLEQVREVAPSIGELLAAAPGLRILATSREPLHVRGERQYPVPPLALPAPKDRLPGSEELSRFEAIQLFVERARAVRPDFALTDDNAAAVVDICRRLDGLPLAIELATARLNLFEPEALRERLGNRLQGIGRGARDLPERQQTLRSTIDWSYRLLEPAEQRLFEVLSLVTHLSFEAIEGIAAQLDLGLDPLDGLSSLIDQSLVRRDGSSALGLLQTIREFAAERLAERPDLAEAARVAHARWFTDDARGHLARTSASRTATADDLVADMDDLEDAWTTWRERAAIDDLDVVFEALGIVHEALGRYRAIIDFADQFLAVVAGAPDGERRRERQLLLRTARARALMAVEGYTAAVEQAYEEALAPLKAQPGASRPYPVLRDLSRLYLGSGRFDKAEMIGHELLASPAAHEDPRIQLDARLLIANGRMWANDLHASIDQLDQAIATFDAVGGRQRGFRIGPDPRISTLTTSAFVLALLGYPDTALVRADRAVTLGHEIGPYSLVYALYHNGFLHFWRGEPQLVAQRAAELLDQVADRDFPIWRALGTCLAGVADALMGQGEAGLGRFEEGLAQYRGMRTPPAFWGGLQLLRTITLAQSGRIEQATALIDEAMTLDLDPASLVYAHLIGADLAAARGEDGEADRHLTEGLAAARRMDSAMLVLAAQTRRLALARRVGRLDDGTELRAALARIAEGHDLPDVRAARDLLEAPEG